MTLSQYLDTINQKFKAGNATEHTFRGALEQLIETVVPTIRATNEPKRQSCGAPDYILTKKDNLSRPDSGIPVGFIEAKDIGDRDLEGLKKTGNKEQFDRYKASLGNLIFTDYLNFILYREGEFVTKIAIGEITTSPNPSKGGALEVRPLPENFASFENFIKDFCSHHGQTIKSSKKLAEMMAGKARNLSAVIEKALTDDEVNSEDSTLKDQLNAFKQILIHDITPKSFADVYAQTIAYGMFAARLHDSTLPTFSRQEAYELIPKSNPFLKKLFGYIAGLEVDDRIKWIVDDLVNIFLACNVDQMLKNYGKSTKTEDPIIHFYETFLSEYDPKLRKARGVWYTPHPVVSFQVRAIDEILKTEFNLPEGIADSSKIKIKVNIQGKVIEQEVHRVQMLDPATGTATYIAEVIKEIYKKFEGQEGIWSNYVENHLLPRLIGFELLMASYAMAHLQIDLLLKETGFVSTREQRLKIYLTNSLEESHPDTGTLFANWLSNEANEANRIKRDVPVMIVMGNPPYSGESANKGEWIMSLMEDYKKEPGGKEKIKERNPKWINDDYVKFIRYGQHYIEKNGSGVLAFINPHGFLDNPTFRGMRWNLLKTYDKIYTIDLHGNSKKKETAPDGSADVNVFDIMQGVSINLFVKTGKKKSNELGKVFHFDLFGKREYKYDFLIENSVSSIQFKELPNIAPNYFFVNKDFDEQKKFDKGFSLNDLFTLNSAGIVTARDEFTIHFSDAEAKKTIENFIDLDDETARRVFNLGQDVRDWSVSGARTDLKNSGLDYSNIVRIVYRPFEDRYTYFTGTTKGFHCMPRGEVMKHLFKKKNICLICPKQVPDKEKSGVYISNFITGHKTCSAYNINNIFPLYLYPENISQQTIEQKAERTPNLNAEIVNQIAEKLGLKFTNEKVTSPNPSKGGEQDAVANISCSGVNHKNELREKVLPPSFGGDGGGQNDKGTFAPIDILDYIYAVLHSPTYREKYKEFLKIDFPRVPYPKDKETFWQLVKLGGEIRQIHLLESPIVEKRITQYPIGGNNEVIKPRFISTSLNDRGRVYINETQYFDNVPEVAWSFFIGGYQPAQKWLKDRKERLLEHEDVIHYQKIIVALTETDRLMKEIDKIEIE